MHTGYLFRTRPGWDLWTGGPPNHIKDGIQPLAGIVETDWLPFPFTMNWLFTRPGRIRFDKGEPFCFISLTPHRALEQVQPVRRSLASEPDLRGQYEAWRAASGTTSTPSSAGATRTTMQARRGSASTSRGEMPSPGTRRRRTTSTSAACVRPSSAAREAPPARLPTRRFCHKAASRDRRPSAGRRRGARA